MSGQTLLLKIQSEKIEKRKKTLIEDAEKKLKAIRKGFYFEIEAKKEKWLSCRNKQTFSYLSSMN